MTLAQPLPTAVRKAATSCHAPSPSDGPDQAALGTCNRPADCGGERLARAGGESSAPTVLTGPQDGFTCEDGYILARSAKAPAIPCFSSPAPDLASAGHADADTWRNDPAAARRLARWLAEGRRIMESAK